MSVKDSIKRATAKQNNGMQIDPRTGLCMCDVCVERRRGEAEKAAKARVEREQRLDDIKRSAAEAVERARAFKAVPLEGTLGERAQAAIDSVLSQVPARGDDYDTVMRQAHFDRQRAAQ